MLNGIFSRIAPHSLIALLATLWVACGDPLPAPDAASGSLTIVSGNAQFALPSDEVERPIRAVARDRVGRALAGVPVTFRLVDGDGALIEPSAVTNAAGEVRVRVRFGAGKALRGEVSGRGMGAAPFVVFALSSPDLLRLNCAFGEQPFSVKVTAREGATLLSGVELSARLDFGTGTFAAASATTAADGTATFQLTPTKRGTYFVRVHQAGAFKLGDKPSCVHALVHTPQFVAARPSVVLLNAGLAAPVFGVEVYETSSSPFPPAGSRATVQVVRGDATVSSNSVLLDFGTGQFSMSAGTAAITEAKVSFGTLESAVVFGVNAKSPPIASLSGLWTSMPQSNPFDETELMVWEIQLSQISDRVSGTATSYVIHAQGGVETAHHFVSAVVTGRMIDLILQPIGGASVDRAFRLAHIAADSLTGDFRDTSPLAVREIAPIALQRVPTGAASIATHLRSGDVAAMLRMLAP